MYPAIQQDLPAQTTAGPQPDTSDFERYMALKLLRENMFFNDPERYAYTDIAEDLPGAAKPIGHLLKNVLPSATIISNEPETRKAQIQQAIARIKASAGSQGGDLPKEMLHNAINMGKSTLLPALLFSAVPRLLGFRGFRTGGGPLNREGPRGWRSPIAPIQALKKLFSSPTRAKGYAKDVLKETLGMGVLPAALTGAVYPWLAHKQQVSDQALTQAQKIMEEQPYITSLPTSELLSAIHANSPEEAEGGVKNIAGGAGIGAAMGAISGVIPTAMSLGLSALTLGKYKPRGGVLGARALKDMAGSAKFNAILGGITGGLQGATTKNFIQDEYRSQLPQTPQASQQPPDEHQKSIPYQA